MLDRTSLILVIIGALNWGSVGLFKFDFVGWLFGGQAATFSRIIFTLVGLAGLWCISLLFRDRDEVSSEISHMSRCIIFLQPQKTARLPSMKNRGRKPGCIFLEILLTIRKKYALIHLNKALMRRSNPFGSATESRRSVRGGADQGRNTSRSCRFESRFFGYFSISKRQVGGDVCARYSAE